MKAIVLHEYGGPEKLKYEDFPDPIPGEGEVLVRLAATSVNPVDIKMRSGEAKERFPVQFPGILGRDVAGIVRALGPKVDGMGFAPGDKVIAFASATYAELVVVKATDLTHLPEGLDLIEAAALPLVTLTGEQLISRGAKIQAGQTILVTGAVGGVGRSAVHTAKKAGAKVIAGVRKKQLKEAGELGADQVLALDDEDAMAKLGFLDAVADTVGGETAQTLIAKVKQGGVFASVLGPPANATLHPTVRVEGVRAVPDAATLRTLAEDVLAGRFKIPIDRMLPLEKAGEAHAAAEKGGIGKVLLLA
jgi:NADPH:quinone reductase-like Zn-dependent oxidoreductase